MQRKPGGYRTPSVATRVLSVIPEDSHREWFQQIWTGLARRIDEEPPGPVPVELAERLIRMFSFVGDTVLDPFMGTGTTNIAASRWGQEQHRRGSRSPLLPVRPQAAGRLTGACSGRLQSEV